MHGNGMVSMNYDRDLVRKLLFAVAIDDEDAADALYSKLNKAERTYYLQLTTAFFTEALASYFRKNESLDAVQTFAAQLSSDSRNADPKVPRQEIEDLLRAMLGHEDLFGKLTPKQQFHVQVISIQKIVRESKRFQSKIEGHLREAELIVDEWMSEHQ